jgi:hypothetical protein
MMAVQPGQERRGALPALAAVSRFPFSRPAFWGGGLFLVLLEALASLTRATLLPDTPFFRLPGLWLSIAICKGLIFGPVLGVLTLRVAHFWRRQSWDEACYLCLRGGFGLCGVQAIFALCCFLAHSHFPRATWMVDSWPNFALWLTLNGAFLWALLLLIAGFLLPSDARKSVQVSDNTRF